MPGLAFSNVALIVVPVVQGPAAFGVPTASGARGGAPAVLRFAVEARHSRVPLVLPLPAPHLRRQAFPLASVPERLIVFVSGP